jgi:ribosome-binding factor A
MAHSRIERVEEVVKEALGEIIQEKMADPRLGFSTIVGVKVSKDLRHAVVHISFLTDVPEESKAAMEALNRAKGFLRYELGQAIKLKFLPDLHFVHDSSASYASHIQELLQEVKPEEGWVAPEEGETEAEAAKPEADEDEPAE